MPKTIAIIQSNYIPWRGYFDLIRSVDECILFDQAQYTKNDWRNRNLIKTPNGLQWLTIPVLHKSLHQKIRDTQIARRNWAQKHWQALLTNYGPSRAFKELKPWLESLYNQCKFTYLSEINYYFIQAMLDFLGISTKISWDTEYQLKEGKTEKLLHLVKQAGGTEYLSGPAAKAYLDEDLFKQEHIRITWMDYGHYLPYQQLYSPFEAKVSILDLILNEGKNARNLIAPVL
ncbi:MAG: WbqC family protein [Microscillaceae bacterium]|nr:WbqC family protein [Microscillaceae bacterium]